MLAQQCLSPSLLGGCKHFLHPSDWSGNRFNNTCILRINPITKPVCVLVRISIDGEVDPGRLSTYGIIKQRRTIENVYIIQTTGRAKVEVPETTTMISNCLQHNGSNTGLALEHSSPRRGTIFPPPVHTIDRTDAPRKTRGTSFIKEASHVNRIWMAEDSFAIHFDRGVAKTLHAFNASRSGHAILVVVFISRHSRCQESDGRTNLLNRSKSKLATSILFLCEVVVVLCNIFNNRIE